MDFKILRTAEELKHSYPSLTDYERLSLSIQYHIHVDLVNGLGISGSEKTFLEMIGMCLGAPDKDKLMSSINGLKKD